MGYEGCADLTTATPRVEGPSNLGLRVAVGRSITDFFSKNPGPILSPDVVFVSPSNSSEGPSTALPRLRSGALASPQPRLTGSSLESPSRKRASLSLGSTEAQPSRAKGSSLCRGFLPPGKPAVPFVLQWPIAEHGAPSKPKNFKFSETGLVSNKCVGYTSAKGKESCDECAAIQYDTKYKDMHARVQRVDEEGAGASCVPSIFLTPSQMLDKLQHKRNGEDKLLLFHLNLHRVASRGRSRIETFDRLIVALSDKNVPRLRQLVQVALRQGRGPNFIIEQVSKAAQGVYHAKGWKDDPDAIDLAFLVLKIGGPLLLTAVHKATQNLPCVSWVKANGSPPKFAPYYGIDMEGVVKQNIMTNRLVGICYEHQDVVADNLVFNSIEDLQATHSAVCRGEAHLAVEVLVVFAQPYRNASYAAIPILALSSCKRLSSEEQHTILQRVQQVWQQMHSDGHVGMLLNLDTDGQTQRRVSLHKLHSTVDASDPSCSDKVAKAVWERMQSMPLMDPLCGAGATTTGFDLKHLLKRLRTCIISPTRNGMLVLGVAITRQQFQMFCSTAGVNDETIKSYFDPKDKQNVPIAVKLLKTIAGFSSLSDTAIPTLPEELKAAKLLGEVIECLLAPLVQFDATTTSLLEGLSKAAHILFVCFSKGGNKFMPSVQYHDLVATIKTVFWNVAKIQLYYPESAFYIFMQGTDCGEQLFAVLRTLTHNTNFDPFELNTSLGTAQQINAVFERHPDWSRASKRLQATTDHANPTSWRGDVVVDTDSELLAKVWKKGQDAAIVAVRASSLLVADDAKKYLNFFELSSLKSPKCTLSFPIEGKCAGVEARTNDITEVAVDEDEDNEVDDTEDNATPPLEDMLATTQEVIVHSPIIQIGGKSAYKASAILAIFGTQGSDSSDRLRRVAGTSKCLNPGSVIGQQRDWYAEAQLCTGNPVAAVVSCGSILALGVFRVKVLHVPWGNGAVGLSKVPNITLDQMQNGAAKVTGTLMSLTFQEPSEENPSGTLRWTTKVAHADTTFIAAKVVPLDMTTTYKPEGGLTLAFDVGVLQGIFEEEVDTIPLVAGIVPTDTSPPIAVSATFPYCGGDTHKDRLLCNGAPIMASSSQAQPTQVSSTLRDTMHACRVLSGVKGQACGIMVKLTNMRQHVAMHMLRGDCGVVCGVTPTADEACGFCGMIRSHGECSVKLAKGSGSCTKIVSQCPYANNNLRYGSITNKSKFAPSTNRPVECKICKAVEGNSKEQYCVWSYQYLDHLQQAHPAHVVSDQDKKDYAISAAEFESVVSYGSKTKADSKAVIRRHVKRLKMVVEVAEGPALFWHWRSSACATSLRAPGASQLASRFNPRATITTPRGAMRQIASRPKRQHESIPSPCAVPTSPRVADGLNRLLGCQGRNVSTAISVADIQRFKAMAEDQNKLLVFDFYVPSNSMCARIHEMVEEVAAENKDVMFVKVNRLTEELRPFLRQVTARRTFHIWKSGTVIAKMTTSLLPEVVFPMGELRGELRRHAMAAAAAPTGAARDTVPVQIQAPASRESVLSFVIAFSWALRALKKAAGLPRPAGKPCIA
eukprot:gene4754-34504_t